MIFPAVASVLEQKKVSFITKKFENVFRAEVFRLLGFVNKSRAASATKRQIFFRSFWWSKWNSSNNRLSWSKQQGQILWFFPHGWPSIPTPWQHSSSFSLKIGEGPLMSNIRRAIAFWTEREDHITVKSTRNRSSVLGEWIFGCSGWISQ